MDTNKILNADVLDIIFDGKNKEYGAYDLRKTYPERIKKALFVTGGLILLIVAGTFFAKAFTKEGPDTLDVLDTKMAELAKDAPPPPPPPPPPPKAPPPPEIKTIKFTPPVIKKDEEVKPDEKPPELEKNDAAIATTTNDEGANKKADEPASVEKSEVVAPAGPDPNEIFTKVEKDADFPGGPSAWARYLQKNLNPNAPIDNGAPEGTYTVMLNFVVNLDGSITEVTCLPPDPGYGMCDEAKRVIKRTSNWTPALQNGRNVRAYRKQPITFVVQEQ